MDQTCKNGQCSIKKTNTQTYSVPKTPTNSVPKTPTCSYTQPSSYCPKTQPSNYCQQGIYYRKN